MQVRARDLAHGLVSARDLHRALANLAWELTVSHLALLALATFKYALATFKYALATFKYALATFKYALATFKYALATFKF
ncbi:hypothetical protein JCGZ_09623 [Jatropha curcas]|uniref:Uncharacterized protein n=1 Tax=Jatropha curcas TaxID=180498 RepID=A0A067LLU9_JATCU|nr:hypothetical protein JCGZ_09623 [Jatropha curcas]